MKYDLFVLDFFRNPSHSLEIARQLRAYNAPGLIAICKANEESLSLNADEQEIYLLDKPILAAKLHKLICDVHCEIEDRKQKLSLVEIRGESGNTRYISKEDVIYAQFFENEMRAHYCFTHEETMDITCSMDEILRTLGDYKDFELKLKNLMVNTAHIQSETKKSILLSNGESFEYPLFYHMPFFRR